MLERGYQASLIQSSPVAGDDPEPSSAREGGERCTWRGRSSPAAAHTLAPAGEVCSRELRALDCSPVPRATSSTNSETMHIAFAHDHAFHEDAEGHVHSRGG